MSDERAAFAGQITDLPVVELLRTISNGKKTGVARFETNLGTATVWFREGTLVDADMGRFHMGDAVRRLIATDAGSFEVEFKPVTRRRLIQENTSDLLAHTPQPAAKQPPKPAVKPKLPPLADDARAGPRPRTRAAAGWKPTAGGTGRDGGAGAASPDMLRRLEALRRVADRQPPRADVLSSTAALGTRGPEQAAPSGRSTGETPQAGLEALNRLAQKASKTQPAPPAAPPVATPVSAEAQEDRLTPGPYATPVTPPQPLEVESELDLEMATRAVPAPTPPQASPRAGANTNEAPSRAPAPPKPAAPSAAPREPVAARPGRSRGPRPTAAIESRRTKRTSSGIPAQSASRTGETAAAGKKGSNGWTFVDPNLAKEAEVEEDERTDQTLMRMGPLQLPQAPSKRPGGKRKPPRAQPEDRQAHPTRVDPAEDLSDPLPIGTSWSAPAHVAAPRSKPIDSDGKDSAGGEIGKGSRASAGKTVVAFAPQTPAGPDPGGTMTAGFRPITDAEGPDGQVPGPNIAAVAARGVESTDKRAGTTPPGEAATGASGGAQVGRYEVLLRIARGGMGTVYLCQVTGTGGFRRLFALKVIRDHLSRNEEYVRMLLQEARIASRLHHPNVVGIVDIGNLANQHYLVMDYVEGCTLSELLKVHRKTRPPHLIIPIVLDALTGLHAAHSLTDDDGSPLTLVHCDFSPQNMLVGTNGICRITDFGIARASNALPERSSITRGKPAYLAPEQITGRPFDHRADIFASGVVLWNALTGEQLFKGDTPEEVLDKVLNMQIPAPSTVGLRPPKKLDKVVLRALERDPARRYQSAEEMLIELRKVAIGNDLLAPSSEVAQWVADTFGAQLELRRQAAGLAPNSTPSAKQPAAPAEVTALALRDEAPGADDSATHALLSQPGPASDASSTMMLQSGKAPAAAAATRASDAVLGDRARKIVIGMVVSACATLVAIAVVRPELLTGGMLDEGGEYIDLGTAEADPNFDESLDKPAPAPKPATKPETAPPKGGLDVPDPVPEKDPVEPPPVAEPEVTPDPPANPSAPPPQAPRNPAKPKAGPKPAKPKADPKPPKADDKPAQPKADDKPAKPKADPKPPKADDKPAQPKADPKPAKSDDKPAKPKADDKPDAPELPSAPKFDF